jgi:chemotaxis protein CheX
MLLDDELVRELTIAVWNTVLGLDVASSDESPPSLETGDEITTSVDISGAWDGTISLSFSPMYGRRLAAMMLDCAESQTTTALIRDAVGELANVVGGNVKGVLPGPSKLSLPRVEAGMPSVAAPVTGRRVWFDCGGQRFSVTVRSRPSMEEARS